MTALVLLGWLFLLAFILGGLIVLDLGTARFFQLVDEARRNSKNRRNLRNIHYEWEKEYEARNGRL